MPDQNAVQLPIGVKLHHHGVDGLIATIAKGQHGVVARRDLLQAGVGRNAISHRLSTSRLHPLYRGVYAVGHPTLTMKGIWMAAVLAGGQRAVLSHRSAAALWGVRPSATVELTLPRGRRPLAGITAHRLCLRPDEVTTFDAIPV